MSQEILRKLKEEKLRRLKNEPHRYYVPNERLETFAEAFGSGDYFITLLSAANGIGKTYGAVHVLTHLLWPVGNKFFSGKMFTNWPYPKVGRIVSDPTTVKEAIIPTLEKVFPAGRYTATKEGKQYFSKWETDTGWSFDVMTYDQSVKEFESKTVGWIWLDEPAPRPIYVACVSRLRMGGQIMITETPLSGSAWMYDAFITSKDAKHL